MSLRPRPTRRLVLGGLCVTLLLGGCGAASEREGVPTGPLQVRSASHPAGWLVEYLGRGLPLDHETLVPAAGNASTWRPTPTVVAALSEVDLLVANGAGLEAWMATASLPRSKVVRSAEAADLIMLHGDTHSHGGGGAHSHLGPDPHTWTDPLVLLQQAEAVRVALARVRPGWAPRLERNATELTNELQALHAANGEALAPLADRAVASTEPFWSYLWRRHGLAPAELSLAPDRAPTPAQLESVRAWSGGDGAGLIVWPVAPEATATAPLGEGVQHLVWDPLLRPLGDGDYDYLRQARANLERLAGTAR